MVSKKMYELGSQRSVIRELFEFGLKRKAEIGAENVYDFSLGNPSVPAPEVVKETIFDMLNNMPPQAVFSYTSAAGDPQVREDIATSINKRFDTDFTGKNIFMTVGAAASISVCFKGLANEGDDFITIAPYFPEYKCFVEATGANLLVVPPRVEDFQIDFDSFEEMISDNTKAVIINTPNNPSGAVYSLETIERLVAILKERSEAYGHPIYLISDEPYREIVYDGAFVPYLPHYYDNTLVCYSYSKSLSLPGARIGYVVVPNKMADFSEVFPAIAGAARALGYVCAPNLFQKLVARCADETADISIYKENRDTLYNALTEMGYECVKPEGAFYLMPKSLEPDAAAFCERAKAYDILIVPGDSFGCPGHIRISYCVSPQQVKGSLEGFQKLYDSYQ